MDDTERRSAKKRSRFDQKEPEPKRNSRFDRRSRSPPARGSESRRSRSPLPRASDSPAPDSAKKIDAAAAAGRFHRVFPRSKDETNGEMLQLLPPRRSMRKFKP